MEIHSATSPIVHVIFKNNLSAGGLEGLKKTENSRGRGCLAPLHLSGMIMIMRAAEGVKAASSSLSDRDWWLRPEPNEPNWFMSACKSVHTLPAGDNKRQANKQSQQRLYTRVCASAPPCVNIIIYFFIFPMLRGRACAGAAEQKAAV